MPLYQPDGSEAAEGIDRHVGRCWLAAYQHMRHIWVEETVRGAVGSSCKHAHDQPIYQPTTPTVTDTTQPTTATQVYSCLDAMLDRIAKARDDMDPEAAGHISLEAAFEGLWARLRREDPEAWGDEVEVHGEVGGEGAVTTAAAAAVAVSGGGAVVAAAAAVAGGAGVEPAEQQQQQQPATGGEKIEAAVRAAVAAAAKQQAAAAAAAEARQPLAARLPPAELRRRLMQWHMANIGESGLVLGFLVGRV